MRKHLLFWYIWLFRYISKFFSTSWSRVCFAVHLCTGQLLKSACQKNRLVVRHCSVYNSKNKSSVKREKKKTVHLFVNRRNKNQNQKKKWMREIIKTHFNLFNKIASRAHGCLFDVTAWCCLWLAFKNSL